MFFHERSLVSVFDVLDLSEQVVSTVMGTSGAQQKVYFARSGDFSRDTLEKFSAFYFETVRENLFRLWGLETNGPLVSYLLLFSVILERRAGSPCHVTCLRMCLCVPVCAWPS